MLNLVSLSTQSLASCVNYFVWNCLTCFSNTKIGSVTSFSILFNFQGPVRLNLSGWRLDYFTTEVIFCQALFLRSFWSFANLEHFKFLGISRNFSASIGSFQGLPAELSEVILLSQRLALKYNTTPRCSCQHFLTSFFQILCARQKSPCFSLIIIAAFSWQGGGQNVLWNHSSILYEIAILII